MRYGKFEMDDGLVAFLGTLMVVVMGLCVALITSVTLNACPNQHRPIDSDSPQDPEIGQGSYHIIPLLPPNDSYPGQTLLRVGCFDIGSLSGGTVGSCSQLSNQVWSTTLCTTI